MTLQQTGCEVAMYTFTAQKGSSPVNLLNFAAGSPEQSSGCITEGSRVVASDATVHHVCCSHG